MLESEERNVGSVRGRVAHDGGKLLTILLVFLVPQMFLSGVASVEHPINDIPVRSVGVDGRATFGCHGIRGSPTGSESGSVHLDSGWSSWGIASTRGIFPTW